MVRLNRRQFLVAGAAGTAGAALAREARVLGGTQKPWNDATGRALHKYRDPLPTVCTMCAAQCAITAYRDGDRVAQIGPNRAAGALAACCARAYQSLESLYDPERVLKPLRRKGKRGSGEWQEITWADALTLLGEALSRAPASAYADLGRPDPLAGSILDVLGIRNRIEEGSSRRWGGLQAQKAVYGAALGRPDLSKARTILLLGNAVLDDNPHYALLARDLIKAKARGATIVALSSCEGVTGSLATEWLPVKPGAEAVAALGLVRAVAANGGRDAALLQEVEAYQPEFVETTAGVPAYELIRLAKRLVNDGPTLCLADSSGARGAEALEAAAAVLSSLSGDPEAAGIRFARTPDFVPGVDATLSRTRALKDITEGKATASVYLAYRTNPVYAAPGNAEVRKAFAAEDKVGFLVAVDTQMTETAALADLVLPAAADLELWNLLGSYTPDGKPYALLQQSATRRPPESTILKDPKTKPEVLFDALSTRPLGEARQLGDILLGVLEARKDAARARYPEGGCAEAVRKAAAAAAFGPAGEGLLSTGVWVGEVASQAGGGKRGAAAKAGGISVRGKLSHTISPELGQLGPGTFALVPLRYPELSPSYANTRWGREIRFRNPLLMNAGVAGKMGLAAGEKVFLKTAAGEAEVEVMPVQGIHPQAVGLAEDFGHWAGGVAATAKHQKTGDEPVTLLVRRRDVLSTPLGLSRQKTKPGDIPWWSEHGSGASLSALSPAPSDEAGAQAWREIRVTVRKA